MEFISTALALSSNQVWISIVVVFFAACVRGFAGFGLSAMIMAGLAIVIPPIMLIPVCFLLEATASLAMFRGGLRQADHKVAWGLAITSAIGTPIGLWLTLSVSKEFSQTLALLLILGLALLQLSQRRLSLLKHATGLYITGLLAGVATGIASLGGMVVALYVLSQNTPAAQMRGSLVLFLFLSMFSSTVWLTASGLLNELAVFRAIFLAPATLLGVILGSYCFKPSLQPFYRKFCLLLLSSLAIFGLLKLTLN